MLRFVVEETLAGRGNRLKGFALAIAVFGRDETFNSQSDPVVRFEARRLRRDLDSYYMNAGRGDPVRITIPKGGYSPHFELQPHADPSHDQQSEAAPPEPPPPAPALAADAPAVAGKPSRGHVGGIRARAPLVAVALFALAAVGAWLWFGRAPPLQEARGPSIIVLPFERLGSSDDERYLAAGLSEELVDRLRRFPGFRLYASPASIEASTKSPIALGQDLGVAYVVAGSVRMEAEDIRIAAQLLDAATGRVVWTRAFDRAAKPAALIEVQRDIAASIASEIGQPYGVVSTDLNRRATSPEVANMQSYVCVLQAYGYRRRLAQEEFAPVLACLEEAVRRDPDYSDAWAMLGWAYLDAGRYGYGTDADPASYYARATEAASRSLDLEPTSVLGLKALSAINFFQGNFSEGERLARAALEQNPYDPDSLVRVGWRLAIRGRFDEGTPLVERAIARSVNPPAWYYHPLAIHYLMKGDGAAMLEVAEHGTADGSARGQALLAMAQILSGNEEAGSEALVRMNEITPGYDPLERFAGFQATAEILEAMASALHRAGWPDSP